MTPRARDFPWLQAAAEFAIVLGSFALAWWLWREHEDPDHYVRLGVVAGAATVVVFERLGLYRRVSSILNVREIHGVTRGMLLVAVVVFAGIFYFQLRYLSRVMVTLGLVLSFGALLAERIVVFKWHERRHLAGRASQRVLIYGAGETGKALARRLFQNPRLGMYPAGFIDDDEAKAGEEIVVHPATGRTLRVIGTGDWLGTLAGRERAEEVLIALPNVSSQRIVEIIAHCRRHDLRFRVVPALYDLALHRARIEDLDGIPLMGVSDVRLSPFQAAAKRALDVAIAATVLVLAAPLLAWIAWRVRRDSPGPAIIGQERVGLRGRTFTMYKFRTMYADAPLYATSPTDRSDPRVTPYGRFLRRTSLDELPQFWNVLKGEMSVVGPRPEMPFIVETYDEVQRERLNVKPGITGLWQLSADRRIPIHENMDYDLYYIRNQSILLDLVVIFETLLFAARGV